MLFKKLVPENFAQTNSLFKYFPSLDRNANLHNYLILKSTILDYIVVRSISDHKLIHCRPS